MTLHLASIEQLIEWQAAIVGELARRAAPVVAPVAAPPWVDMAMGPGPVPMAPVYAPPVAAAPLPKPAAAPQMLVGGVRVTDRTDPKLAALFAATPPRPDGVPGVQGRGQGEGMVEFNVPGGV